MSQPRRDDGENTARPALPGDQRDERFSPFIVLSAVAGVLVGVFLWSSLMMSISSAGDFASELAAGSEAAPAGAGSGCAAVESVGLLSLEAVYLDQCGAGRSTGDAASTPDAFLNRADCDAIRGTFYRSVDERLWFLAHCITN